MADGLHGNYDEHLYPTRAQSQLHVDNLYCTGYLRGLTPPSPQRARVMELGCGNGMNLIPMAIDHPGGDFVGVDYARTPIRLAVEAAKDLNVANVRFHQADVKEMAADFGQFDYIIAHGLYSWVPEDVREAFWRVLQGSLVPDGLLFVSFNTLPGWHQARVLQDFSFFHMERFHGDAARLQGAWQAIQLLGEFHDVKHPLSTEAEWMTRKGIDVAIHDELDAGTEPFYFREVVRRAASHGFAYVGDAKERFRSGLHMAPRIAEFVSAFSGEDEILREQYIDFLSMRSFRQSVFAKPQAERPADQFLERAKRLWITTEHRAAPADERGQRRVEAPDSEFRFETDDVMVCAWFDHLAAVAPSNVHLGDWIEDTLQRQPSWQGKAYADFETFLRQTLFSGAFYFQPRAITMPAAVPERPQVSPLNRWESGRPYGLTNRYHKVLSPPDVLIRAIVSLLDGQRSVQQISNELGRAILKQKSTGSLQAELPSGSFPLLDSQAFRGHGEAVASETIVEEFLRRALPAELEQLRVSAILLP